MKTAFLAAVAICTAFSGTLRAQEQSRSSQGNLEEVVVTAQKREERLADVPGSISVLTPKELENFQLTSLADYANYVPGLYIQGGDAVGSARLILRGINTDDGGAPLVATYVDNFPVGPSTGLTRGFQLPVDLMPYDLQRIEVLRGPQGTLYGGSAMGGLIKYVLREPNLNEFQAQVGADLETLAYSSGTGWTARGSVNGPIVNDKLGFLLSGFDRHSPGYIDNVGLGIKDENASTAYGGRAAILWKPTDTLKIQAQAMIQDTSADMLSAVTLDTTTFKPVYGPYTVSTQLPNAYSTRLELYSLDVDWQLGFATLNNTASYQTKRDVYTWDISSLGFLVPLLTGGAYPETLLSFVFKPLSLDKWTEELRFTSSSTQRLQWMVGAFFTNEDTENVQNTYGYTAPFTPPIEPFPNILTASYPNTYRESAGFGELTYNIADHLDVTGGLRYSSYRQTMGQYTSGLFVGPASYTATSSGDATTWSFSSRYHVTPNDMLYVRVASGYRPGGPNVTYNNTAVPPSYSPDKLINYELGFKGNLFDNKLILDAALFYIDWKDIQIAQQTPTTPPLSYVGNAATAASKGLELSATYRPLPSLSLGVVLSYTDAHLTADAPTIGGKNGDPLPGAPQFGGAFTADYSFHLKNNVSLDFGGAYRYRGNIWDNLRSAPGALNFPAMNEHVDLYTAVDFTSVSVRLFATNVFGEQSSSGYNVPFTTNGFVVDPPRTIGISVDLRL